MSPTPSRPTPARWRALRAPLLVAAAGLGAGTLLHLRDPHDEGSYGLCPFQAVTGRPCPGCGGLRAVNDLTHGDVAAAVSSNLLAVLLVGALAVAWVGWTVARVGGGGRRPIVLDGRVAVTVIAVVGLFWVFRLTPWGAWLAP